MTVDEIKHAMDEMGWSISRMAKELDITPDYMGRVLAGKRALTGQLARHIEYVLGRRRSQLFVFTVDLPEGTVRQYVPGWEELSPEEQRKAAQAVARRMLEELVAQGESLLTQEQRDELKRFAGGEGV